MPSLAFYARFGLHLINFDELAAVRWTLPQGKRQEQVMNSSLLRLPVVCLCSGRLTVRV